MTCKRLLMACAFLVFMISLTISSAANAIEPIGPIKPPIQTDPCISADIIFYAGNRVTSSVGGDSNARVFLDQWTLSLNESTWGHLYQREDNFPGVAVTQETILSADGLVMAHGTTVFTDISTFEGARGSVTSVMINGNLSDLRGTYVWSYDFFNFQHTGELRMCIFLRQ